MKFCKHKTSKFIATVKSCWSRTIASISQFAFQHNRFLFYTVDRICVSHRLQKRGGSDDSVEVVGGFSQKGVSANITVPYNQPNTLHPPHTYLRKPPPHSSNKGMKSVPQLLATVEQVPLCQSISSSMYSPHQKENDRPSTRFVRGMVYQRYYSTDRCLPLAIIINPISCMLEVELIKKTPQ